MSAGRGARGRRLVAERRDADRRRDAADLADDRDDRLGDDERLRLALRGQQDRELVAAQAREDVGLAQAVAQRAGAGDDELVAGGVPEAVVDRLEAVEVEHEQGALGAVAAAAGDVLGQRAVDAAAVEQSGERVVVGQVRSWSSRLRRSVMSWTWTSTWTGVPSSSRTMVARSETQTGWPSAWTMRSSVAMPSSAISEAKASAASSSSSGCRSSSCAGPRAPRPSGR